MKPAQLARNLGTESAFAVLSRAEELSRRGHDIINLGIGQPDYPVAKHILDAAEKAVRDGPHGYSDARGTPALRETVADYLYDETGRTVDPGSILITPGAKVGLFFASLILGETGAEILYPDPGFPIYSSAIRFSGATPVAYPLSENAGFSFLAHEILERITTSTRLIIINSPANPTGGIVLPEELKALVEGLEKHPNVAILSDEVYRKIHYKKQPPESLLSFDGIRDRLILVDGWSKTYAMTGWRLGFSIWPKSLIDIATRLAINVHSCVNNVAQAAGIAALKGPQDAVYSMVKQFENRRSILKRELADIPHFDSIDALGAFYAFPKFRSATLSSSDLQDTLLEHAGVAVISGQSFGLNGDSYVRFSYVAGEHRLVEACARIKRHLDLLDPGT